jgi:glutamine amidotransferase-like uncharacterized protein
MSIQRVVIYSGHITTKVLGPYPYNIAKRFNMFKAFNTFRKKLGEEPWKIQTVPGEELVCELKKTPFDQTLLALPAGKSTNLDRVFKTAQYRFLIDTFFNEGGMGYLNCGSAYWASKVRVYDDVCLEQPSRPKRLFKTSHIPIFDGEARGPLCPFPATEYQVGFFSDAVRLVHESEKEYTVFLNGGGYFIPRKGSNQTIEVVARYHPEDLERLGRPQSNSIAALVAKVGSGGAFMSMYHPYYGAHDIDVDRYEKVFPGCGTNWRRVHAKLSSEEEHISMMHDAFKRLMQIAGAPRDVSFSNVS